MANEYGNYCTWNPLKIGTNITLSNGNRTWLKGSSGGGYTVFGTIAVSSGKWYWENKVAAIDGSADMWCGVIPAGGAIGSETGEVSYRSSGVRVIDGSNGSSYGNTYTANDVIRVELDMDAATPTVQFFKNDNAETGGKINLTAGIAYVARTAMDGTGNTWETNFGSYPTLLDPDSSPSSGFKHISTANLPTPAVINYEDEYFIKAGISHTNGSTTAVTLPKTVSGGAMVRIKETDATTNWIMFDTVRGVNKSRDWNDAAAEDTSTFDDQNLTGTTFTMPSDLPSGTYLLECFYVGSYFQIQTVTGNAGARTITWPTEMDSYGFSAFFPRTGASSGISHHKDIGAQQILFCDGTGGAADRANFSQAPNKTDFRTPASVGPDFNLNTIPYVCYGWANSGPYAFGKGTGNQSADGWVANVSGSPQTMMLKQNADGYGWFFSSNVFDSGNPKGTRLDMSDNPGIVTGINIWDFLSNGAKIRTNNGSMNLNGQVAIFGAFGIQPLTDGGVNQGRAL